MKQSKKLAHGSNELLIPAKKNFHSSILMEIACKFSCIFYAIPNILYTYEKQQNSKLIQCLWKVTESSYITQVRYILVKMVLLTPELMQFFLFSHKYFLINFIIFFNSKFFQFGTNLYFVLDAKTEVLFLHFGALFWNESQKKNDQEKH